MAPDPISPSERAPIAAEAFLRALADHGVDFFFANPGTDFPPVIEAFSRARTTNAKVPQPIWCRTKTSRSQWRMAPI